MTKEEFNNFYGEYGFEPESIVELVEKLAHTIEKPVVETLAGEKHDGSEIWISIKESRELFEEMERTGNSPYGLICDEKGSTGIFEKHQDWEEKLAEERNAEWFDFLEPAKTRIRFKVKRPRELTAYEEFQLFGLMGVYGMLLAQHFIPVFNWNYVMQEDTIEHIVTFRNDYGS